LKAKINVNGNVKNNDEKEYNMKPVEV